MPEPFRLRRLRVLETTESSFGVSQSFASALDVPFLEGTLRLAINREPLPDESSRTRIAERFSGFWGLKSWELSFEMHLRSHGATLDATTLYSSVTNDALDRLLTAALGARVAHGSGGGGSLATGTPSTTSIDVTNTQGDRFLTGRHLLVRPNGTYYQAREVDSRATDTIGLKMALSAAPVATDPIYGAATYHFTESPSQSVQFRLYGRGTNDQIELLGGALTIDRIVVMRGRLATIRFVARGVDYNSITGDTFLIPTYLNAPAIPVVKSQFLVQAHTTTTRRQLDAAAGIEFRPEIVWQPHESIDGVQGVLGWICIRQGLSGAFMYPLDADVTKVYELARDNRTLQQVWCQIGAEGPGKVVSLSAPTVQVTGYQSLVEHNEQTYQAVEWMHLLDQARNAAAGNGTDMENSPFRLGRM